MKKWKIAVLIVLAVFIGVNVYWWQVLQESEEGYQSATLASQNGDQEGRQTVLDSIVSLRNPTYEELMKFLAGNQVNRRSWVAGRYVCVDFAADLNNDAEAAGIRTAYVWLVEKYGNDGSKLGHLLNGFQTVDRGFIFIEPQTDAEVTLEIGDRYYPYIEGTIKEIIVVW